MPRIRSIAAVATLAFALPAAASMPFTYQGQLKQNGAALTGTADFTFELYDAATNGNLLGSQLVPAVPVTGGIFTVSLNGADQLGAMAFNGSPRWLAIQVNGALLTPRQQITQTPYAAYSDSTRGLWVDTSSNVGVGGPSNGSRLEVSAALDSTTGASIKAINSDPNGYGIYGLASSVDPNGNSSGGVFETMTPYSSALVGHSLSTNGGGVGVYAVSDGAGGAGLSAGGDVGVVALGNSEGVHAYSNSIAVHGYQSGDPNGSAIRGEATDGYGGYFTSSGVGVFSTGNTYALWGDALGNGAGVFGHGSVTPQLTNVGVMGDSSDVNGVGVYGKASSIVGYAAPTGVKGETTQLFGTAVAGVNTGSSTVGTGVYGYTTPGGDSFAGWFQGTCTATTLTANAKYFCIDHPLDPENKLLRHSCVESPDMKTIYDGIVTLDPSGAAWVDLPSYFDALNGDFRYQLTAVGAPGPNLYIKSEISGRKFQIAGGSAGQKVSWQVTGIRHDPVALKLKKDVESDKPAHMRGRYFVPEAFGQPADKALYQADGMHPNLSALQASDQKQSGKK